MKKTLALISACAVSMLASAQQIEMSKADCSKWQKAFVFYRALEEVCGYQGQVSEMMGKFSAAGSCQSRLSSKDVAANTNSVLQDTRRDVKSVGKETFCAKAFSNYYELQKQYEESGSR